MWFASRFTRAVRCSTALFAAVSLFCPALPAQAPPASLQITILEGDDAMNNIRQRIAREPIVQVEDENHKPVAGAVVLFLLPNDGAGGTFANGAKTLTVTTGSDGRAVARGLRPNHVTGRYQIKVTATLQGVTAQAAVNQTNVAGAGAAGAGAGIPKWVGILIVGAVGATVATVATRTGSGTVPASNTPVVVIPTTSTVGPPR